MPSSPEILQYQFKGKVWRLLPNEQTGCFGVEVRDTQSLQVYFCLLQPGCPQLLLDHFQVEEKWWAGLAGFSEEILYLHGFDRQGTVGQPMGVTAVQMASQKVLFIQPTVLFEAQHGQNLYCSEAGERPKKVQVYEANTGQFLQALTEQEAVRLLEDGKKELAFKVDHSEIFTSSSSHYTDLTAFIAGHKGHVPVQEVEYLETDTCFILSYYVAQEVGLFDKFLVTYSLNGEALNEFCLVKDAERIGGPAFFVQSGFLFLLQHESVLVSVPLPVNVNFD
ncbi:DUF4905 domain-containing protein [Nibribacter ruber]|uniref:DUF4905 domain-containing protein n=1 Tax=Nibribacter ruber TaxID=2698458 RepID=A0A6P1NW72_9BACT|nr:DUF4905 domain-containing protein [Nibribacter ruber]QHL86035.1 DUF4905 domain-containing protein [Nibribacter ruber]